MKLPQTQNSNKRINMEIVITEKEVRAAFSAAKSKETKQILTALFGQQKKKMKPTLDNYKTIKTYEDACEALDLAPIYSDLSKDVDRSIYQYSEAQRQYDYIMKLPKHILALMKLEIISRALWGRKWKPEPSAYGIAMLYYPSFTLLTSNTITTLDEKQRDILITTSAGKFGCLETRSHTNFEATYFGFRLSQETEEKAEYFGQQFIELWAEYLFNFN